MRLEAVAIGHVHHLRGDVVDRGLDEIVFRVDADGIERRQRRELRPPSRQRREVRKRHGFLEPVRLEAAGAGIIGRGEHEPLGESQRRRIGERAIVGLEGAGVEGSEREQRRVFLVIVLGVDFGRQIVGQRLIRNHRAEQPVAHSVRR